jgi:tetratricopeptide (TPR) repeat protein
MPKTIHAPAARKPMSPLIAADEILSLANEGRWDVLESRARTLALRQPAQGLGWKALGSALMQQGKFADAATALARLVKIVPADIGGHNNLALALAAIGRPAEAEASYRRALKINPHYAGAHQNLAGLLARLGRLDEALAHQRLALALEPQRAEAHVLMAHTLREMVRLREAEASYRHALELQPDHFDAHLFLGLTLADLAEFDGALAHLRHAVALRPGSHPAQLRLGSLLSQLGLHDSEMRQCLQRCIDLEPHNADGYIALGNEFLRTKELARSQAMFEAAQALRPLLRKPAIKETADFSVLMLDTAGAGCTPVDYLSGKSVYDRNFYCVMARTSPHVELLKTSGAVVFNMIGDADNGAQVLPFAVDLADRLGMPVINHPRAVLGTSREAMAARLAGTPNARIAKTVRLSADMLASVATNGALDGLSLPLLVRTAGTHGGDAFEKVDSLEPIAAFVARHPGVDFYVTEYVDYRSADGLFRKYRFICIDGELLPYHLAIHSDWMVHHFRTDMANQRWMQQEEEAFLARPHETFDAAQQAAVLAMARATGLDYCGVDVGIAPNGDVVFFESNATMLVHDEKDGPFVFKNPYIARIKRAFDAMIARRAGRAA